MIRCSFVVLALLLGAAPAAEAQSRGDGQQRGPDVGPIHMLIQFRSDLDLTPGQIAQLERIDADMENRNQPLVAQMSAIRAKIRELGPAADMSPEKRARFEAYLAEARPLMDRIQRNNAEAMRQVGEVLTEPQRMWIARQLRQLEETNRERSARFPRIPGRGN